LNRCRALGGEVAESLPDELNRELAQKKAVAFGKECAVFGRNQSRFSSVGRAPDL
jgi:hypothetical protein